MKLSEINKKYMYVGNCIDSDDIYGDATIFAQAEEKANVILKDEFIKKVIVPHDIGNKIQSHEIIYLYDSSHDIYMLYDTDDDIHYFFN